MLLRLRARAVANETVAGPLLAVAIAVLALALLAPFTPPIAFNDGLGYDGRVYADLTAAMRGTTAGRSSRRGPSDSCRARSSPRAAST